MHPISRWATFVVAASLSAGCSSTLGDEQYTVELAYQGGSNYGPTDATGTAVVDGATGRVAITVRGLPMLTDEVYEGWLAGGDEAAISTGRFNTDAQGNGSSLIVLGDLSDTTYERVVITVEPEPDPSPGPDPRHSIEGPIE